MYFLLISKCQLFLQTVFHVFSPSSRSFCTLLTSSLSIYLLPPHLVVSCLSQQLFLVLVSSCFLSQSRAVSCLSLQVIFDLITNCFFSQFQFSYRIHIPAVCFFIILASRLKHLRLFSCLLFVSALYLLPSFSCLPSPNACLLSLPVSCVSCLLSSLVSSLLRPCLMPAISLCC